MTTFPPIQPRPILCKAITNNIQSTPSPIYLVQPSSIPNPDLTTNNVNSSSQIPSIPLTPSEEFLKRLRDFHRSRQTTFRCLPTIAGQVVDLYSLYNTVTGHGGWDKVNDRQLWPDIAEQFSLDSTCLNGTQALKNIYIRYLFAFEKISNGETLDYRDEDNEDAKRRTASQLQRVPQSYNHAQHNVPEALRTQYGLFSDFVRRNEFEKLELALLCGFPNELTFTLNTLLLLSSSSSHTKSFHLYKCPRLLDLLLRHMGLFSSTSSNDCSLKMLYENLWTKHFDYQLEQFWFESCSSKIFKLFFNIDREISSKDFYENFNLNSNENSSQQQFRIEQILMIIRNLSFDRPNALYLLENIQSSNSLTYQFLLLSSYCYKKIELQKYAWEIWTNLSIYMHLNSIGNNEGLFLRELLNDMLEDIEQEKQDDRLKIIRALEIISNLAHAGNDNGIYLIDYIPIMIDKLLHIPDILVLVHTLECLYQLTELGEQLCNAILQVQSTTSVITTLIDLLTIEARSFSSQTIKTIKIVEMSTGPVLLPSYHQPPPQSQSQPVLVIAPNQSQQYIRPITITNVNSTPPTMMNHLSITTAPSILANAFERKRKHDAISESIAAVVNGTASSPLKRPRPLPTKKPSVISDELQLEKNTVGSTLVDLLQRCSPSTLSLENEVRSCLNDLCQRVVFLIEQSSSTDVYNQLPSPVFQRKIETQINGKKLIETDLEEKKQSPIEQDLQDVKPSVSTTSTGNTLEYQCEWENCRASFATPRAVFHHVCSAHVKYSSEYICLWNGCDRLRRQKWALISHLQERHCSEMAFRQAKLKSTNLTITTTANANAHSIQPTHPISNNNRSGNTMGYAPDAAWLAIRRHMQIGSFDEQMTKSKEGPLTKSIRLTAALILRNIARHSSNGKQNLRQYEQLLTSLALDSSEASHTISSCLFELYN